MLSSACLLDIFSPRGSRDGLFIFFLSSSFLRSAGERRFERIHGGSTRNTFLMGSLEFSREPSIINRTRLTWRTRSIFLDERTKNRCFH